jgi:hypothetical protein
MPGAAEWRPYKRTAINLETFGNLRRSVTGDPVSIKITEPEKNRSEVWFSDDSRI